MENIINILQGLWRNNQRGKFFFSGNFSVEEYNSKTQDKEAENTYSDLENNNDPLADVKVTMP